MHNVKELEDRWFNYKVKQMIMPAIKVSSLYLLMVGSYYMYDQNSDMLFSPQKTNVLGVSMEANDSLVEKKIVIVPTIPKLEEFKENQDKTIEEKEKIVLSPIIPVIDMEKEERISETVKKHKHVKKYHASKQKNTVKAKKNTYLTAKELAVIRKPNKRVEVVPPRKTKKIHFSSTSTNYVERMKQKFSKSNSPRDALLLAKAYYKKNQYSSSEKWALSANKLDNSLEDSWLFFAKSKAKLGKKKEALRILVSYYKKSHSPKAKRLIGQIKTGRI